MNKPIRITNEFLLYSLTFILAAAVRLILLGRTPLTENEASWAYQAWQIWKGETVPTGSIVSYLAVSEGVFSIFGSSNFAARFSPALTGSLLIWTPYLIRKDIGRKSALVAALGIAFDPALVSVSRIAGSPMPALLFLLLAGLSFHQRSFTWSLVFLFLGAFSGPAFWKGVVLIGFSAVLAHVLGILQIAPYLKQRVQSIKSHPDGFGLSRFFLPLLVVIGIGSFFFTQPMGLSAWAGGLPEYFQGWYISSGVSPLKILAALPLSNPFILIFGGLGFLSAWFRNDHPGKIFSIWFIVSLFLVLIYPARRTADLIWIVIPLWLSAGLELVRIFQLTKTRWFTNLLSGLVVMLVVLNWQTFTGMVYKSGNIVAVITQWGLIAASVALTIVAVSIIASEYGWPAANKGLAVGSAAMLIVYTISALMQGAYLRSGDSRSVWVDDAGIGQMDLLMETLSEVSVAQTGRWDSVEGAIFNPSPAILWLLRDMKNFQHYEIYDPDIVAPVMLTRELDNLVVSQELYRGQDFVLITRPGWQGIFPDDWISWIAFREGPLLTEDIILWVRNDVLTGN